jgi:hypothetical protein
LIETLQEHLELMTLRQGAASNAQAVGIPAPEQR